MTDRIRALIMDADGVLQNPPLGWMAGWVRLGGPGLMPAAHRIERPTQVGAAELEPLLAELLAERKLTTTVEQVTAHWCRIEVDHRVLQLVDRVRAAGVLTAMGTNQNPVRGRYMLEHLPYAEHFDALFHSWQLGVAKPDPAFFSQIVETLGVAPHQAVFVDDMAENLAGARQAGLHGVHFPMLDTIGHLRRKLRRLGVPGV